MFAFKAQRKQEGAYNSLLQKPVLDRDAEGWLWPCFFNPFSDLRRSGTVCKGRLWGQVFDRL